MAAVRLSKLEYQLMEILWDRGASTVRDVQQSLPEKKRPAYTTVQTTMFRMEIKGAVKRVGQSGVAHLFQPLVTREKAQRALLEDLLAMFGGGSQPVMAHLVESGRLTMEDIKDAEKALRKLKKGGRK